MPKHALSNPDAKLAYLNGHFGYFLKCILSTNALGLVRDVNFFDSDNTLSNDLRPQYVKDSFDAKSLIPALETHFQLHPNFSYKYFLGDAGFDAMVSLEKKGVPIELNIFVLSLKRYLLMVKLNML